MEFKVKQAEQYSIFTLQNENLNSIIAPELKSKLVLLASGGTKNLILDLSDVKFVDSSGLSAILTGNRLWNGDEGTFILTGIEHSAVKKLIEISRLDTVLKIIPTLSESVDFVMMDILQRELNAEDSEDPTA